MSRRVPGRVPYGWGDRAVTLAPGHGSGSPPTDRSGLVIIRAWIEAGSSDPLRAQVRLSTNLSAGFERTVTLARVEEVCALVKEWLVDFLADEGVAGPQD